VSADDRLAQRRLDRPALLLLGATVAMVAIDAWVLATVPFRAQLGFVVREATVVLAWAAVGVVALWVGRGLLARRFLALSLVLAANVVGSFGLVSDALLPRLLVTLTAILVPLQISFAAHMVVSYPTGALADRIERGLVAAAYLVGGVQGAWWAFTHIGQSACPTCARSLSLIVEVPSPIDQVASTVFSVAWVSLTVGLVTLVVVRYRRAGARQRRLLRLPYLSILVVAALYAALTVAAALRGARTPWVVSDPASIAFQIVSLLGIPLSFLVALLHERLSYRPVGDLVAKLAAGEDTDLQQSLAIALQDPQLSLAFPVDHGYVDAAGRNVLAPTADDRTTVTIIGARDAPLAIIRHDRSLDAEPALLTAAGSATRLALENARLNAEVRAQLREVRESRARIVAAANAARARIERDLHDGAQQRLLAIGLALQMLRQSPGDNALLDAAESELMSALAELRELASGIHPAVLTDLGLIPALRALGARLGTRVVLDIPEAIRRCSPEVEAAAYFAASEAITNALKHASPSPVRVEVTERSDKIVIQVSDHGPGGADHEGAGIVGVRDRLASVDGIMTIDSPPGQGTALTMEVPCA
jgi:signal transduction histidine kinase